MESLTCGGVPPYSETIFRFRVPLFARKGERRVSANWVTANFMNFDKGTFLGTPVDLLLSSQKWQGELFPQPVKIHYFCSGPISVDPNLPATEADALPGGRRQRLRGPERRGQRLEGDARGLGAGPPYISNLIVYSRT